MAMTATECSRVLRERRACGKIVLSVVVVEDDLAEIARAGYAEAASTDRKDREAVVRLTKLTIADRRSVAAVGMKRPAAVVPLC
jgi:hypothetical protein